MNYPAEQFETIVVDDSSPCSLEEVVAPFVERLNLTLITQPRSGPAMARNRGAEASRGRWIAFLDDDCVPQEDWLSQMEVAASQWPDAMLGGFAVNGCSDNVFADRNQKMLTTLRRWLRDHDSPLDFFPSNNIVVPAEAFRRMGGFDTRFKLAAGEDREFCARWMDTGERMIEVPRAGILHYHPQTLLLFLRMHFRYGRGAALLHRCRRTSARHLVESGLQGSLVREALRSTSLASGLMSLTLLVLAQAVEGVGYAFEALSASSKV